MGMTLLKTALIALISADFTPKLSKPLGEARKLVQSGPELDRSLGDATLTHNHIHNPFPLAGGGRRFTHFGRLLHFHTSKHLAVLPHLRQAVFPISSPVSRRTAYVQ